MRGLRQRQELAAAKARQRELDLAAGRKPRQPALTRLAPGQHLETRAVLAGAYRGRDIGERSFLTHAVLVEGVRPGHDVRTLCSQPVDNMADTYSDPEGIYEAPTCPACLPRWERLQERYLEDMHAEPDMERNGEGRVTFGACDDCVHVWKRRPSVRKKDAAEMLKYMRHKGICGACGDVACELVTVDPVAKEIYTAGGERLLPNARRRGSPLHEGELETGRVRGTSGRFLKGQACDFCGKSCVSGQMSDERICGTSDGPGFMLCDKAKCQRERNEWERAYGLESLGERYAEGRKINEERESKQREATMATKKPFRPSYDIFSRSGALQHAESHGHQMGPWEGNVATCERCGQTVLWQEGDGPRGDAWQRGSRCEMRSNGKLRLVDPQVSEQNTAALRKSKLRAARGADFGSALISAGSYAKGTGAPCYVYAGNSFGHAVWRSTAKKSDATSPINNTGGVVHEVSPDLTVTLWQAVHEDDLEPNHGERRYYVWVLLSNDTPKDEGPYGPYEFIQAKGFARISATEGEHDRAVSVGRDPESPSFYIARRYERGTGRRIQ